MAARIDPDNLQPGEIVDGWRVVKRIDAGSYGVVYEVEKGGQPFAMKIARHREESGDRLHTDARLLRELSCLCHLRHPNILRAWGSGRWPDPRFGVLYIIVDLIHGYPLSGWAEAKHLTAHELAVAMEKLFSALEHMHGCNVLHRDLSLKNVLVSKADDTPVIIDFSVADYPGAEALTDGPVPPGTPRNRSPEAIRFWNEHRLEPMARYAFKPSDDVFGLGASLYDVLTDPTPARRGARPPLGNAVLPPPSPFKATGGRVPERLSAFVMTLIDPDPAKRPSAQEGRRVAADLARQTGPEWHAPFHPPAVQVPPATEVASLAVTTSPPEAAGIPERVAVASPAPARVSRRAWSWPALWGALALVTLLVGVAFFQAEMPTSPLPRLPSEPPTQQEARPTVKPSVNSENTPTPTDMSPSVSTPERAPLRKRSLRQRCALAVGMAAWLELGCQGVQVRPEPDEPCPKETVAAMEDLLHWETSGDVEGLVIIIDVKKGEGTPEDLTAVFTDGPVQGAMREDYGAAPKGTLLDGHLWTSGDRIYGRYFRAHVPGKGTVPVCVEIYSRPDLGGDKFEGSRPGAAVGRKNAIGVATKRYR
jgi:serine/threonine-protein kinase